jgi:hypothetical protein
MKSLPASVLAASLLLSACGAGATNLDLPDDPGALILVVEDVGGFAPLNFLLNRPPRFALTAGGDFVIQGPVIQIYPGPLLPNLQTGRLDEETFQFTLEEIEAIGLSEMTDEVDDEASSRVADATTTVVTFYDDNGAHRFSVYALGIGGPWQDERVGILENLVQTLEQTGFSTPTTVYQAERIQVYAGIDEFEPEPAIKNVQPWPLPVPFEQMTSMVQSWSCAVFEGSEAAALFDAFGQANQATRWEAAGTEYNHIPRPLLPGEEPCRAVRL